MNAINFIKSTHKKFKGIIDNNVYDENGLNYNDYEIIYHNSKFPELEYQHRHLFYTQSILSYIRKLIKPTYEVKTFHSIDTYFKEYDNKLCLYHLLDSHPQLVFNIIGEKIYEMYSLTTKHKNMSNYAIDNFILKIERTFNDYDIDEEMKMLIEEYIIRLKISNVDKIIELIDKYVVDEITKKNIKMLVNDISLNTIEVIMYYPDKQVNSLLKLMINYDCLFNISLMLSTINLHSYKEQCILYPIKYLRYTADITKQKNKNHIIPIVNAIKEARNILIHLNNDNKTSLTEEIKENISIFSIQHLISKAAKDIHYSIYYDNIYKIIIPMEIFYSFVNVQLLRLSYSETNYFMHDLFHICKQIFKRILIKITSITHQVYNVKFVYNMKYSCDLIDMVYDIFTYLVNETLKKYDIDILKHCQINDRIINYNPLKINSSVDDALKELVGNRYEFNINKLYMTLVQNNIVCDFNELVEVLIERKIKSLEQSSLNDNEKERIRNNKYMDINEILTNDEYCKYSEIEDLKYYIFTNKQIKNKIINKIDLTPEEIKHYIMNFNNSAVVIYHYPKSALFVCNNSLSKEFDIFYNKYYNNEFVNRVMREFIITTLTKIFKINHIKYTNITFTPSNTFEQLIRTNIYNNTCLSITIYNRYEF